MKRKFDNIEYPDIKRIKYNDINDEITNEFNNITHFPGYILNKYFIYLSFKDQINIGYTCKIFNKTIMDFGIYYHARFVLGISRFHSSYGYRYMKAITRESDKLFKIKYIKSLEINLDMLTNDEIIDTINILHNLTKDIENIEIIGYNTNTGLNTMLALELSKHKINYVSFDVVNFYELEPFNILLTHPVNIYLHGFKVSQNTIKALNKPIINDLIIENCIFDDTINMDFILNNMDRLECINTVYIDIGNQAANQFTIYLLSCQINSLTIHYDINPVLPHKLKSNIGQVTIHPMHCLLEFMQKYGDNYFDEVCTRIPAADIEHMNSCVNILCMKNYGKIDLICTALGYSKVHVILKYVNSIMSIKDDGFKVKNIKQVLTLTCGMEPRNTYDDALIIMESMKSYKMINELFHSIQIKIVGEKRDDLAEIKSRNDINIQEDSNHIIIESRK